MLDFLFTKALLLKLPIWQQKMGLEKPIMKVQ